MSFNWCCMRRALPSVARLTWSYSCTRRVQTRRLRYGGAHGLADELEPLSLSLGRLPQHRPPAYRSSPSTSSRTSCIRHLNCIFRALQMAEVEVEGASGEGEGELRLLLARYNSAVYIRICARRPLQFASAGSVSGSSGVVPSGSSATVLTSTRSS